ncbi:hypothetical protein [Rhodococcus sp. 008]|uniref:hypothetical protein n=1 Tax=Rhodococcus sp. 008 TaxID=1723645 RepID=UPI0012EA6D37|nr:hypothetical protein [Rhodococcus sp. 008]
MSSLRSWTFHRRRTSGLPCMGRVVRSSTIRQLVGFANPELIFDTMVGTGRAGTPGCNIVICNNELLPFSVADLLGDAAAQIGNAAGASIRDAGR